MQTQHCQGHQNHHQTIPDSPKNFAARVAYKKSRRGDVYMCLQQLHWLPIKYRTMFKLLTIAYNAVHGKAPHYLKEKLI